MHCCVCVDQRLGHEFTWSAEQPSLEYLLSLRSHGDPLLDELLPRLHSSFTTDCVALVAQRAARHRQAGTSQSPPLSLDEQKTDADCCSLLQAYSTFPAWVDWQQVELGQTLFQRNCQVALMSLMYR